MNLELSSGMRWLGHCTLQALVCRHVFHTQGQAGQQRHETKPTDTEHCAGIKHCLGEQDREIDLPAQGRDA